MKRVSLLILITLCLVGGDCTVTPDKPTPEVWTSDEPRYDADGYEVLPNKDTIILKWEYVGFEPTKVEVLIMQGEYTIKEFETIDFTTSPAGHKLPVYTVLIQLPPGQYEVMIRCFSSVDPTEWSEVCKFSKEW